jgi:hypothetical protein
MVIGIILRLAAMAFMLVAYTGATHDVGSTWANSQPMNSVWRAAACAVAATGSFLLAWLAGRQR